MHTVKFWIVMIQFADIVLQVDAEKCVNGESIACILNETTWVDGTVENSFGRFDGLIAANNEVDDAVSRKIESLDINEFAPGLYVCVVGGLVGAVLNSVAIGLVILWVRRLKSVATNKDTDTV
jgi:hypothetical protein